MLLSYWYAHGGFNSLGKIYCVLLPGNDVVLGVLYGTEGPHTLVRSQRTMSSGATSYTVPSLRTLTPN
jgi:hypothetical protein